MMPKINGYSTHKDRKRANTLLAGALDKRCSKANRINKNTHAVEGLSTRSLELLILMVCVPLDPSAAISFVGIVSFRCVAANRAKPAQNLLLTVLNRDTRQKPANTKVNHTRDPKNEGRTHVIHIPTR